MQRGQTIKLAPANVLCRVPIDKRVAEKGDRLAVFIEYTSHGYARVAFYGDRQGLTYTEHPEAFVPA